jgi:hypothetical protein
MEKLVIDRATWGRGQGNKMGGSGDSCLLSPKTGKKCCLGFYALACGYSEIEIRGKAMPWSLDRSDPRYRQWQSDPSKISHGDPQAILAGLNDEPDVPDEIREAWIAEGFRVLSGYQVEVEFV